MIRGKMHAAETHSFDNMRCPQRHRITTRATGLFCLTVVHARNREESSSKDERRVRRRKRASGAALVTYERAARAR